MMFGKFEILILRNKMSFELYRACIRFDCDLLETTILPNFQNIELS